MSRSRPCRLPWLRRRHSMGIHKDRADQEGQRDPAPYDRYTQIAGRRRRWFFGAALRHCGEAEPHYHRDNLRIGASSALPMPLWWRRCRARVRELMCLPPSWFQGRCRLLLSCPRDHLAKRLPSRHFSSCICLIEAKSSALNTVAEINWIHFVRRSMMPCQGARPPIRWRGDINAASSSERRSIIVLLQDYVRVLVQVEAHAKCMQRYTVFRVYGLVVFVRFFSSPSHPQNRPGAPRRGDSYPREEPPGIPPAIFANGAYSKWQIQTTTENAWSNLHSALLNAQSAIQRKIAVSRTDFMSRHRA